MPESATETALSIYHLFRALERSGRDVRDFYAAAGLDAHHVADFEVRLPIERIAELWALVMRRVRDPALPIRAAQAPRSEGRSAFALLLSSCATLREAVGLMARYGRSVTDAFGWRLEDKRDAATFVFEAPTPRSVGERCHAEYHVADGIQSVRHWTHTRWEPLRVAFRHAAPPDVRVHREHFGPGLVFGAPRTEVVLPRFVMELPLVTASPALTELVERHIRALVKPTQSQAARLKLALLAELERGKGASLADVARRLGMSPRTLHRRLAEEGTTYQCVLDETRREIADDLLAVPGARIKNVSLTLGFSDPRAFRRAFQRWTGRAPRVRSG
jgi:AraC-like DNA-binding protein